MDGSVVRQNRCCIALLVAAGTPASYAPASHRGGHVGIRSLTDQRARGVAGMVVYRVVVGPVTAPLLVTAACSPDSETSSPQEPDSPDRPRTDPIAAEEALSTFPPAQASTTTYRAPQGTLEKAGVGRTYRPDPYAARSAGLACRDYCLRPHVRHPPFHGEILPRKPPTTECEASNDFYQRERVMNELKVACNNLYIFSYVVQSWTHPGLPSLDGRSARRREVFHPAVPLQLSARGRQRHAVRPRAPS